MNFEYKYVNLFVHTKLVVWFNAHEFDMIWIFRILRTYVRRGKVGENEIKEGK